MGSDSETPSDPAERISNEPLVKMRLVCEQGRTGVSACSLTTQLEKKAFSEAWQTPLKLDPAGSLPFLGVRRNCLKTIDDSYLPKLARSS